jgi:hypothetical protein
MRRRLSRMLLRRVGSAASSLAAANAELAAANNGLQIPASSVAAPVPQPPSSMSERKQSLKKASSSASVLGTPEFRPDAPRSVLSANPSLDAKVKALLARAEAYKKETQARMVPVVASSTPSGNCGTARCPSSTSTTYSSTSVTGPPRSMPLTRSSISSLKTPTVSEVADDAELAAAEAAYRHSKQISASIRYSTASGASRGGRAPRTSSSVGSRESIYSTASSGVTEFGTFAPSTAASHRTRSRAVSASNGTDSGAPPSAFYFSPATSPLVGTPKHAIGSSVSTLSSTTSSPVSVSMSSPSASTAPSSARQSLMADFRLPDESDASSRIAKLSNASTTSISSAAHSLTPSLFSINSMNSADSSGTSDGGGMMLPLPPASRSETVNIIPPEIDECPKANMVPSLRAPRKQLSRRSSLAPLAAPSGEPDEMSYSPDEGTNNSTQLRKSSTPSTHSPHFLLAPSKMLPYVRTTHQVPVVPQSVPSFTSSRLRASTAPHPLSTPIS